MEKEVVKQTAGEALFDTLKGCFEDNGKGYIKKHHKHLTFDVTGCRLCELVINQARIWIRLKVDFKLVSYIRFFDGFMHFYIEDINGFSMCLKH